MSLQILVSNPLINAGVVSWITAQVIKFIYYYGKNRKVRLERLSGAGGMPSAHSAVSCSVAVTALLYEGFSSPVFAVTVVFALIVMYDATGVRWEAGLHARAINHLVEHTDICSADTPSLREEIPELNESLGHRRIEVLFGALLGIAISLLMNANVFYK